MELAHTKFYFDDIKLSKVTSRKWAIDLTAKPKYQLTSNNNTVDLQQPPGYVERTFPATTVRESDPNLMRQRSWNIALGPLRQVPMNLFIMWISGNSVSIFPLVSMIMLFLRPIQALFSAQTRSHAIAQCFVYVFGNLVILALAMYKCHTMGLLPAYASDWLSFVELPVVCEFIMTLLFFTYPMI